MCKNIHWRCNWGPHLTRLLTCIRPKLGEEKPNLFTFMWHSGPWMLQMHIETIADSIVSLTDVMCSISIFYKKALLSQRRPRDAPNIWVPWKVLRVLANAPGYFSRNLKRVFVPIDTKNVHTKFEVRSLIRFWDNRGTQKNWAVPRYAHAPFSLTFLKGFCSDGPCEYTCQIWSS